MTLLFSCSSTGTIAREKNPKMNIKAIVSLTSDGLPVFITLTGSNDNKLLLTNTEFHHYCFGNVSLEDEFPALLKKVLSKKKKSNNYQNNLFLSDYKIDTNLYRQISSSASNNRIKMEYFDACGVPLYEKFSEETINAVIAVLVDRGIVVHSTQFSPHAVFAWKI